VTGSCCSRPRTQQRHSSTVVGSARRRDTSRGRRKGRSGNHVKRSAPFERTANKTNTDRNNVRVIVGHGVVSLASAELYIHVSRTINGTLAVDTYRRRSRPVAESDTPWRHYLDGTPHTLSSGTKYNVVRWLWWERSHRCIVIRYGDLASRLPAVRVDGLGLRAYVTSLFPTDRLTRDIYQPKPFSFAFSRHLIKSPYRVTVVIIKYQSSPHRVSTKFIFIYILTCGRRTNDGDFLLVATWAYAIFDF